ncbi:XrtA/PEP-CTERM system histidine kinase PrsK [Desulfonatronum parangueonense]
MLQTILSISAIMAAIGLPLYLLARRRLSPDLILLFIALTCTACLELFDLLALRNPEEMPFWRRPAMFAEALLPMSWLGFSLIFARKVNLNNISAFQILALVFTMAFPTTAILNSYETFYFSPDFAEERILFLTGPAFLFYVGILVILVLPLINLETTLIGSAREDRWKVKLALTGAGVILVGLLFYYSQGLLYRTINMQLVPVRSLALLLGTGLIGYSMIQRSSDVHINLSRQMALKSVVLLTVGLYLLGLGLLGEGMKYFGQDFPKVLLAIISLLSGVMLLVILMSASFKRKIQVFLVKHFYENKYDYREEWQKFTTHLSRAKTREELLTAVLGEYCDTFGMGCAALYLRDYESNAFRRQFVLAMDRGNEFIAHDDPLLSPMRNSTWVRNLSAESWETHAPSLARDIREHGIILLAPFILADQLEGFIAMGNPLDKNESYGFEDYDLIKAMSRQVALALLNFRLADQLAQAREMEAVGKVSTFVAHDLKNLVYTLSLMLDNAKDYMADPEFQSDMLQSLGNTINRMKMLITRLKTLPGTISLRLQMVDIKKVAEETAAMVNTAPISITGHSLMVEADPEELHKVMLNLLLNALDATEKKGPVHVDIIRQGEEAGIRVQDKGCGISTEFLRDGLFTPFKTTKPGGLGIGLYQCKQIITAHGGRVEVQSTQGQGSTFTVWLPLHQQE